MFNWTKIAINEFLLNWYNTFPPPPVIGWISKKIIVVSAWLKVKHKVKL